MLFNDPRLAHETAQKKADIFGIAYVVYRTTEGLYKVQRETWASQVDGTIYTPQQKGQVTR